VDLSALTAETVNVILNAIRRLNISRSKLRRGNGNEDIGYQEVTRNVSKRATASDYSQVAAVAKELTFYVDLLMKISPWIEKVMEQVEMESSLNLHNGLNGGPYLRPEES
jgi:hypothetical protein